MRNETIYVEVLSYPIKQRSMSYELYQKLSKKSTPYNYKKTENRWTRKIQFKGKRITKESSNNRCGLRQTKKEFQKNSQIRLLTF